MNYERMWKKLKRNLVGESGNMGMDPGAAEHCRGTLLSMARIESEEYEKEGKNGTCDYTVRQDITGTKDFKVSGLAKEARKMFEQITGHKVIESLRELENEIWERKHSKSPSDKTIVVDECVDIPEDIRVEAAAFGIKIAGFKVDVISTDALPKGAFIRKETSPDGFPGAR